MHLVYRIDFLAGLLFLAVGLFLVFVMIPVGIVEPTKVPFAVLAPSYYPRLVAIAMVLIGLAVTARAATKSSGDSELSAPDGTGAIKLAGAVIVMFAVAFTLPELGFVLGTAIGLAVLLLIAGERSPIVVLLTVVLLPLGLYVFFTKMANIPIPGGVLDPVLLRI